MLKKRSAIDTASYQRQNILTHQSGTGTSYASYVIVSPLIITSGGSPIEPKIT